jgi:hypothetical protein
MNVQRTRKGGIIVPFDTIMTAARRRLSASLAAIAVTAFASQALANSIISYSNLLGSPLDIPEWSGQFTFLDYGGPWTAARSDPALTRVALEAQTQGLLTPTWTNPHFVEPVESVDSEWDTGLQSVLNSALTPGEAYTAAKQYYLQGNHSPLYPGEYTGMTIKPNEYYSMTGHSFYSVYEAQWGTNMVGIELGEQIIASQSKIAYARGAAVQNNLPLFADISPWDAGLNAGGTWGSTIPVFESGQSEYTTPTNVPAAATLFNNSSLNWNGGHSPSLLSRLWYVTWLSGFSVVVPEDCQVNFFAYTPSQASSYVSPTIFVPKNVNQRAVLSPIGVDAQKFMSVVDAHPNIGIPYTPFGVMVGQYAGFGGYDTFPAPWDHLQPNLGDRETELFWNTVFPNSMAVGEVLPSNQANESTNLVAGPYGDTFDTVLSNASQAALAAFPTLTLVGNITFTPTLVSKLETYVKDGGVLSVSYEQSLELGGTWTKIQALGKTNVYGFSASKPPPTSPNTARWTNPASVWGMTPSQIAQIEATSQLQPYELYFESQVRSLFGGLAKTYLPISVNGKVEYLINRTSDGWVIGLVNDMGVIKSAYGPVQLNPLDAQNVEVTLTDGQSLLGAEEWMTGSTLIPDGNTISITVPAGEVRILDLVTAAPVPEPAPLEIFVAGSLALFARRYRIKTP